MSSHEATTSMPACAARSCCIPSKTSTLSSAMATRIAIAETINRLAQNAKPQCVGVVKGWPAASRRGAVIVAK